MSNWLFGLGSEEIKNLHLKTLQMASMEVFKFGGASVKDASSFRNVAKIIGAKKNLVVVISAIGKTTNKLEDLLHDYIEEKEWKTALRTIQTQHEKLVEELFHPPVEEVTETLNKIFRYLNMYLENAKDIEYDELYDQVIPVGELLSSKILHYFLKSEGIINEWIDIRKVLRTNNLFRKAELDWEESEKLVKKAFNGSTCFVTQGFIAGTDGNLMTTLGREGSDYTAGILANMLNAKGLTVWKDVEGVLNADPRYFNHPTLLTHISYREAIELSYYGATIIHPKTIKPLENKAIPLYVKCFIKPDEMGTTIDNNTCDDTNYPIYIYKPNQVLISLSRKDFGFLDEKSISMVFEILHRNKLELNLMQNSAINFSICLDFDSRRIDNLIQEFQNTFRVLFNTNLELLTIRHYEGNSHMDLIKNHEVLLEQKTRTTLKLLMRSKDE